jgi:hypothetical protein
MGLEGKLKKVLRNLSALVLAGSIAFSAGCDSKKKDPFFSQIREQVRTSLQERFSASDSKLIPSYDRNLSTVIMHSKPDLALQESLIESLPKYSQIVLLTNETLEDYTNQMIAMMDIDPRRVHITAYDGDYMNRGLWAQDIMEVLSTSNGKIIVLPEFFTFPQSYLFNLPSSQSSQGIKSFLENQGFNTITANSYFEGGNVTYDYFNNKKLLFIGDSSFINRNLYDLTSSERSKAVADLHTNFGADLVYVAGQGQDSTHMFHLDQAFLLTGPGEVVLMDLSYATPADFKGLEDDILELYKLDRERLLVNEYAGEASFLEEYDYLAGEGVVTRILDSTKTILEDLNKLFVKLGYKVHRYPLDPWQNIHFQSYMNSVVFKDKESNKKKILLPMFPNSEGEYDFNSKNNKAAQDFFKGMGLEVIPVLNPTWSLGGNINCLMAVYE